MSEPIDSMYWITTGLRRSDSQLLQIEKIDSPKGNDVLFTVRHSGGFHIFELGTILAWLQEYRDLLVSSEKKGGIPATMSDLEDTKKWMLSETAKIFGVPDEYWKSSREIPLGRHEGPQMFISPVEGMTDKEYTARGLYTNSDVSAGEEARVRWLQAIDRKSVIKELLSACSPDERADILKELAEEVD